MKKIIILLLCIVLVATSVLVGYSTTTTLKEEKNTNSSENRTAYYVLVGIANLYLERQKIENAGINVRQLTEIQLTLRDLIDQFQTTDQSDSSIQKLSKVAELLHDACTQRIQAITAGIVYEQLELTAIHQAQYIAKLDKAKHDLTTLSQQCFNKQNEELALSFVRSEQQKEIMYEVSK